MPEEKKESFTFSDKIKNSKAAGSKSFAKSSSKIGRDGKPKQTLFERTRRDAPFFIAALVALLLLPFLYKFSGQASEDPMMTPGSEETTFDPERYGFDTAMIEDPDGQIAQLSGRDSLSLIKGWGSNQAEDFGRDDMDFDAAAAGEYDASREYSANRSASTNIDEEENITNIYKRRARAGTRAAFRRTQIGTINPATMRRGGGNRLGINNWGGSMKEAAKKVGSSGPRNAPKPVSLQPLRAAGPARSSFGGGAAQAARKGLDNMGKANAVEALRDSYVKPVDPTRTGGIDLFSDGRSGGSGKLGHNINIGKGETPWWWDMMKTRMQEEWKARFNRKWDWIKWADKLAQNILGNLINCVITGDDGGDVDKFLGISVDGGSDPTCCGVSEGKAASKKEIEDAGGFEKWCKVKTNQAKLKELGYNCSTSWKGGVKTDVPLGPVASRLKCLGLSVGAYGSGSLGLSSASGLSCADMPNYSVVPSGQARKWNIYTYVVVRNYAPQALVKRGKVPPSNTKNGEQYLLCGSSDRKHGGTSLEHNEDTAGVGHVTSRDEDEVENVIIASKESSRVTTEQQRIREQYLEYDQESLRDACVMVVSRGNVLPYEEVKNQIMDLFMAKYNVDSETAAEAFFQLDLMFVESFATKHKLAYAQWFETGHQLVKLLPMPYWEFENAYINHRKVTHKLDGSKDKVYKAKWRIENVDMVKGDRCFYGLQVDCGPGTSAQAYVKFNEASFKGGAANAKPNPKDVNVSAEFRYLDNGQEGAKHSVVQPMTNIPGVSKDGYTFTYTFLNIIDSDKVANTSNLQPSQNGKSGLVGNIVWTVTRGAEVVTQTCPLNLSGDITPYIETSKCTPGEIEKSPAQKVEGQCQHQRVCSQDGTWGAWQNVPGDTDCEAGGGSTEKIVHFYDLITKVPCPTDVTNGTRRVDDKTGCLQWNSCKLTEDRAILLPLDNDTKQYVARAKAKFDKANASQKITLAYNEESLSVANLIDAIMIDPDNGTVPANTVCLLGKSIGSSAKDPQAPAFDNLFGVFLAFIGYDAASFPSQKTYDCNGDRVTDRRFLCRSEYYWGGYVNSKERINYERQVDAGPWKGFPLRALMRNPLPKNGNAMQLTDKENRVRFHSEKPNGYADLMTREPCRYDSNQTVSRADVIEYINRLCQYGDQIKPKATKKYDCSKKYSDGAYHQERVDCDKVNCFD